MPGARVPGEYPRVPGTQGTRVPGKEMVQTGLRPCRNRRRDLYLDGDSPNAETHRSDNTYLNTTE
eukprot:2125330-Rhodomonas_salina.2